MWGRFLSETLVVFSRSRGEVPCLLLLVAPSSTLWEVLNIPWFSFILSKVHIVAYALLKGFLIKGVWELRVILSLSIFRQIQLSQKFRRHSVHLLACSLMCQEPHPHFLFETWLSKLLISLLIPSNWMATREIWSLPWVIWIMYVSGHLLFTAFLYPISHSSWSSYSGFCSL